MDILSMTFEELSEAFAQNSIQSFRAKQVWEWLHKHQTLDYDEMLNLPKTLRAELKEKFPIIACAVKGKQTASDGTVKMLYEMQGGDYVECVIMKYKYGLSLCVSTEVGCKMGCAFCASTIGGFKRRLTAGEMLSEIYLAQKESGERISHIVLMGMGEPLDNFDNVMRFISLATDE